MNRVKRKSICVTAIPCVIIFKRAFEKYQLGAVASQVYERLNLTDSQFPGIMTASMIPSVFLSIVSGVLVDRLDIKKGSGDMLRRNGPGLFASALCRQLSGDVCGHGAGRHLRNGSCLSDGIPVS